MKNRVKLGLAVDKNTFFLIPTLFFSKEKKQVKFGIVFLCFGFGVMILKK